MVRTKYLYIGLLATCASAFLPGCALRHHDVDHSVLVAERPELSGQVLWQQAMLASRKTRTELLIQAASHFLASGKLVWAERALVQLSGVSLSVRQQQQVLLLRADCLVRKHHYVKARRLLPTWPEVSLEWSKAERLQWCQTQRQIAEGLGHLPQLVLAWQRLADQYPQGSEEHQHVLADLWGTVVSKPVSVLRQARKSVGSQSVAAGWLDLGLLVAKQASSKGHWSSLHDWMLRYPTHPARAFMEEKKSKISWESPKKVALLLPLSGHFKEQGQAIRRGFYAAYYEHKKEDAGSLPEVAVYDTASHSAVALYQQAVAEGASLVIGPLLKPNVLALQQSGKLSRPTIALNTIDKSDPLLYQFALNPLLAADMIADRLARESRWHVAVFAQDTPWAKRMMAAFKTRWASYHGVVVGTLLITSGKSLSPSVRRFLSVAQSSSRARRLKRLLHKKKIRFVPSRRDDIDAIVLFSGQQLAQQIRPFLSYYFAGDLPVYAGPSVYDRPSRVSNNGDLKGIQFLSTPWQVMPQSALSPSIAEARGAIRSATSRSVNKKEGRFFAMGADSFELMTRLPLLIAMPHLSFYGGTGVLSVGEKQRIVRRLTWARFYRGHVKPVKTH